MDMTQKQEREYKSKRELEHYGWSINKNDPFNSGSETSRHVVCKALVGHYIQCETDYRVSFEVQHDERGEVDVLAWGGDGKPFAVECETSPTEDVISDKRRRYVEGTPIRECYLLNVSEMPENILDAYGWVKDQLP